MRIRWKGWVCLVEAGCFRLPPPKRNVSLNSHSSETVPSWSLWANSHIGSYLVKFRLGSRKQSSTSTPRTPSASTLESSIKVGPRQAKVLTRKVRKIYLLRQRDHFPSPITSFLSTLITKHISISSVPSSFLVRLPSTHTPLSSNPTLEKCL